MKKVSLFLVISGFTLIVSCTKKEKEQTRFIATDSGLIEMAALGDPELENRLIEDSAFRIFTKNLLLHVFDIEQVFEPVLPNSAPFLEDLQNSDTAEVAIAGIYSIHGIDFEEMIDVRNSIDNDINELIKVFPELTELGDSLAWNVLKNAIDYGLTSSTDPNWDIVKDEVNEVLFGKTADPELTLAEVWECFKSAVGISAGAAITIEGIGLASAGIIIKQVTKIIMKNFGWWGAALFIIDFSTCIYTELAD